MNDETVVCGDGITRSVKQLQSGSHREAYPEQYAHARCGQSVRVMKDGNEITRGTIERVISSGRFGELCKLDTTTDGTFWLLSACVPLAFHGVNVASIQTEQTGGGCMVDFVHLKDGRMLSITDDCAVLHASPEAFYEPDSDAPALDLTQFTDADSYMELDQVPHNQREGCYVVRAWSEYPDLDLLLLDDGKIIGITSDLIALYQDYAAVFDDSRRDNVIESIQ